MYWRLRKATLHWHCQSLRSCTGFCLHSFQARIWTISSMMSILEVLSPTMALLIRWMTLEMDGRLLKTSSYWWFQLCFPSFPKFDTITIAWRVSFECRYNDHLFHYGYILYASAILGKLNSTFVAEYGTVVDTLSLDVVNSADLPPNSLHQNLFPFTRHKSWYDGHSFASGLFPFADGKSMESSGESVNCYYGAYLWSTVRWEKKPEYVDFTRLLLAMELRSVKTYWHMVTPDRKSDTFHAADIYNPHFAKNLMVRCFKTTWMELRHHHQLILNLLCRPFVACICRSGMLAWWMWQLLPGLEPNHCMCTWLITFPLQLLPENYLKRGKKLDQNVTNVLSSEPLHKHPYKYPQLGTSPI